MVVEQITFGKTKALYGKDYPPLYWCYGSCGNVYTSVVGHTRMFAINKALRVIDPFHKRL